MSAEPRIYISPTRKLVREANVLNQSQKQEFFEKHRKQAAEGSAEAQFSLGVCYSTGIGVEKDEKMAFDFYTQAAKKGHAPAQTRLGNIYSDGILVPQDHKKAVTLYKEALATDPDYPPAQNSLGTAYYYGRGAPQSYEQAFALFSKAATQGFDAAQCNLGRCYEKGRYVLINPQMALKYYRLSAKQKYKDAQSKLVACHEKGFDVPLYHDEYDSVNEDAIAFYRTIQDKDPYAAFLLGFYYYTKGIPEWQVLIQANADYIELSSHLINPALKAQLLKDLAALNKKEDAKMEISASSTTTTSEPQSSGVTTTSDKMPSGIAIPKPYEGPRDKIINTAAKLDQKGKEALVAQFQKLADEKNAEGQYNLAVCYANGIGVTKDNKKAFELYTLAATQKHAPAENELFLCYFYGRGVPVSYLTAFKFAKDAADQNSPEGQYNLGFVYYSGRDEHGNHYADPNYFMAAGYFQPAADNGFPLAQHALGVFYEWGYGVSTNSKKSLDYHRLAASQKLEASQKYLARYYKHHIEKGFLKDEKAGFEYYNSVHKIDPCAACLLGLCYFYGKGTEQNVEKGLAFIRANAEYLALLNNEDRQLKAITKSSYSITVHPALNALNTNKHNPQTSKKEDRELRGKPRLQALENAYKIVSDTSIPSNSYDTTGERTTLIHLICNGFTSLTRNFLQLRHEDLDLALTDKECGGTPLHWAANKGNALILEALLDTLELQDRLSLINAQDDRGLTPLALAAVQGHLDVVKLLCERGADLALTDKANFTALGVAKRYGHPQVASFLKSFSASKNKESKKSKEDAQKEAAEKAAKELIAAIKDDHGEVSEKYTIRAFLKAFFENIKKASPQHITDILNYVNSHDKTAADYAIEHENIYAILELIKLGADFNRKDKNGQTALHRNPHAATVLVSTQIQSALKAANKSIDVNIQDKDGDVPLGIAAQKNDDEAVEAANALLGLGARTSVVNHGGLAPLGVANRPHIRKGADPFSTPVGKTILEGKQRPNHFKQDAKEQKKFRSNKLLALISVPLKEVNTRHSIFFSTTRKKRMQEAEALIAEGIDPNFRGEREGNLLIYLILHDYTSLIHQVLENLTPQEAAELIIEKDQMWKETALHWAAFKGNPEIVLTFLEILQKTEKLASVINTQGTEDNTPLMYTVGKIYTAKLLIAQGADFKILRGGFYKRTAYESARESNLQELVQFMDDFEKAGKTSPDEAKSSSEINEQQRTSQVFINAIKDGNREKIATLLPLGFDPNYRDHYGLNALDHAAIAGDVELVTQLAQNPEVNINAKANRKDQLTALDLAINFGHPPVITALLNAGAELATVRSFDLISAEESKAGREKTASTIREVQEQARALFDRANKLSHTPTIRQLQKQYGAAIEFPAVAEQKESKGTPKDVKSSRLLHAVKTGDEKTVRALLNDIPKSKVDKGAIALCPPDQSNGGHATLCPPYEDTDEYGYTPLHWAAQKGDIDIMGVLLKHGADINAKDSAGLTPLLIAALHQKLDAALSLIKKGADMGTKDTQGKGLSEYGVKLPNDAIIALNTLLREGLAGILTHLKECDEATDEKTFAQASKIFQRLRPTINIVSELTSDSCPIGSVTPDMLDSFRMLEARFLRNEINQFREFILEETDTDIHTAYQTQINNRDKSIAHLLTEVSDPHCIKLEYLSRLESSLIQTYLSYGGFIKGSEKTSPPFHQAVNKLAGELKEEKNVTQKLEQIGGILSKKHKSSETISKEDFYNQVISPFAASPLDIIALADSKQLVLSAEIRNRAYVLEANFYLAKFKNCEFNERLKEKYKSDMIRAAKEIRVNNARLKLPDNPKALETTLSDLLLRPTSTPSSISNRPLHSAMFVGSENSINTMRKKEPPAKKEEKSFWSNIKIFGSSSPAKAETQTSETLKNPKDVLGANPQVVINLDDGDFWGEVHLE